MSHYICTLGGDSLLLKKHCIGNGIKWDRTGTRGLIKSNHKRYLQYCISCGLPGTSTSPKCCLLNLRWESIQYKTWPIRRRRCGWKTSYRFQDKRQNWCQLLIQEVTRQQKCRVKNRFYLSGKNHTHLFLSDNTPLGNHTLSKNNNLIPITERGN